MVTHCQGPFLPAQYSTDGPCETNLFPDLRTPGPLHSPFQQGKLALAVEPLLPAISIEEGVSQMMLPCHRELNSAQLEGPHNSCAPFVGGLQSPSLESVSDHTPAHQSSLHTMCSEFSVHPNRFLLNTGIFSVQGQETESRPSFLGSKPAL